MVRRHVHGDWGDVCGDDRQQNDLAMAEGGLVLSSYTTLRGGTIWVVTEADRSATTILLPDEY